MPGDGSAFGCLAIQDRRTPVKLPTTVSLRCRRNFIFFTATSSLWIERLSDEQIWMERAVGEKRVVFSLPRRDRRFAQRHQLFVIGWHQENKACARTRSPDLPQWLIAITDRVFTYGVACLNPPTVPCAATISP